MRRGCWTTTVGLLAGALLLAGCDGGSGPSTTSDPPSTGGSPTLTSTTTTSASPTPSPSVDPLAIVPDAARAHTNAGAQAFAEFYLDQLNNAWTTPDPEAIRPYATKNCATCRNYVDTAEGLLRRRERYERDPLEIKGLAYQPESRHSLAFVSVVGYQAAGAVVGEDHRVLRRVPRALNVFELEVTWQGGTWYINKSRPVKVVSQ